MIGAQSVSLISKKGNASTDGSPEKYGVIQEHLLAFSKPISSSIAAA